MNANETTMKIAVDDYRRLERKVARQAFMECEHKNKWLDKCAKTGECYEQGIVDFLFKIKVREN